MAAYVVSVANYTDEDGYTFNLCMDGQTLFANECLQKIHRYLEHNMVVGDTYIESQMSTPMTCAEFLTVRARIKAEIHRRN